MLTAGHARDFRGEIDKVFSKFDRYKGKPGVSVRIIDSRDLLKHMAAHPLENLPVTGAKSHLIPVETSYLRELKNE